jgi:hypothetical protein
MSMRNRIHGTRRLAIGLALAGALLAPLHAAAQSQLDVAQAQAFLGSWVINMETDFGPMVINMTIDDRSGKVGASVGSPEMGGTLEVTDITREGENLVLKYDIDAQGQMIDVSMSLAPAGENLDTVISAAGGQFTTTAVATRAQG